MSEMKTSIYPNRKDFGIGPWMNEPDKANWTDKETELDCMIIRNAEMGNLCGYVGIPLNSKLIKLDCNDIEVNIHGGLTYTGRCGGDICHEAEEEVYWLGFDCAHYLDITPGMNSIPSFNYPFDKNLTYKDFNYVKSEVESLAKQLKALL